MRIAIILALVLAACTPTQEAAAPATPMAAPQTVSIEVSSTSDAEAQRLCGGPARPETVHHESNVITYRCLGGAN
jgi:hypothetical protein